MVDESLADCFVQSVTTRQRGVENKINRKKTNLSSSPDLLGSPENFDLESIQEKLKSSQNIWPSTLR